MRPKEETDTKIQSATFILSEKIDDTKSKKSDKDIKKEMKRLEKEKLEREKREKKAREKEKEREKQSKKAKEKNIYGTRIFLIDGTEIEDNDVLKDLQNEVLVIANEEGDFSEKPSSVRSYSTSSELTIPNSPTSSIGSNISEFQIPYSKFPSVLFSKLSTGGKISPSDVNIIVRNVADELIYNEKLATRSNYRAIAQELCERFSQLYDRDPDTNQLIGTGYYTVFKKLEERVHYLQRPNKRAANSSCSDTTRKKSKLIKNLSSGCKEWQPSDPVIYEDDEITPETKKTWLMSNASLKERDESKVELYMNDTYGLQRTFLNSIPAPAVFTIANEWPVLFEEKYMIVHFDRLCGLNSILCVDTFLSKAAALNEQIHALLPKKQTNSLENHKYDTEKNDINLLQSIARYFKEDLSYIFVKLEEPLTRSDIASRVKTTAPNIIVSGKVVCGACGGKCSGEVLRVSDKYFHSACFTCRACSASLAKGGFFYKDSGYYCPQDYQRLFGTRCAACGQYVEGEVVAALGNTYHQKCFTCARCGRAFPSGEKVTYTGTEVVCMQCAAPQRATARALSATPPAPSPLSKSESPKPNGNHRVVSENECAGCGQELSEGQALVALDRHWHTWCFACAECGTVLRGEYMARDKQAYCERDYQRLYGVKCAYCNRYIGGKVLQAGESHHFHPTCARCCKCGDAFGDGEEMFLQGSAVWHPRCGPAPNSSLSTQSALNSRSPSANGSYYSPYSSLTKCGHTSVASGTLGAGRSSTLATYSYLSADGYLRRPLQPDHAIDHFHRPPSASSTRASSRLSRASRPAMTALVQSLASEVRAAPSMDNIEPIELSHYPSAFKPPPGTQPKIERDDFPAPPYPYTDPERRRRWSDTYKGVPVSDDETDGDGTVNGDAKLKKEEKELSKIESGIAQVFLKEVKEREKIQQWKKNNLDPRNASRTPSARREAGARLRYSSPVGASPSRTLDRGPSADYSSAAHPPTPYNVLHGAPRPGYGLRASTLPARVNGDFTFSGLGDKTHSTDFSSGKSDISAGSITDVDRSAVTATEHLGPRGTIGGVSGSAVGAGSGGVRRSLPNMLTSALLHEPAKLYPYHLLLITNYRLPPDADRLNLERHLSDAEFEAILQIGRHDFYRLPQWRRNELKRRARLF